MANLSNINNKFIVSDVGHVSIGATTTTYPLTVESGGVGTVLRAGTSFVSIDSVGSAASPSLIFNGDSNTGIWRPAADTLGFSTAGSERMRIDSSGDVSIKTGYLSLDSVANNSASVADEYRLALGHDASTDASWIQSNGVSGTQRKLLLNPLGGNVGIGTNSPLANLDITNSAGSVYQQWSYDNSPSSSANNYNLTLSETVTSGNVRFCFNQKNAGTTYSNVLVFNQGNVGIGTDSPIGKTDIFVGASGYTNNVTTLPVGTWSFANGSGGSSYPTLVSKSNATGAGMTLVAATDNSAPNGMDFNIREGDNTDFSTLTTSGFTFSRFGTVLTTILRNGNVGIGTTSPASLLEIFGGGNTLRMDSAGNTSKTFLMRNVNTATAEIKTDGNLDINIEDANRIMRFLNGNTERMRITSGGGVSIGSTNPSLDTSLRVFKAGVSVQARIGESNSAYSTLGQNSLIRFQGRNTANTSSVYGDIGLDVDNQLLLFNDPGTTGGSIGTNPMVLDASGNVGIGTTSPAAGSQLTLRSSGSSGMTILSASNTGECFINFSDNDDPNVGQIFYGHSPDRMVFRVGDDSRMTILGSNGNVGIGTTSPQQKLTLGSVSAGGIQFNYDSTNNYRHQILNYWNSNTDSRMDFNIARTSGQTPETIMSVGYGGNVGIGTTSPEQKLHVEGRGIFDGGTSSDILQIRNDNGGGVFGMTPGLFALDLASTSSFNLSNLLHFSYSSNDSKYLIIRSINFERCPIPCGISINLSSSLNACSCSLASLKF